MKTISRYLMTLVALFAMTTGAWANIATIEFTKETMPGKWKNNFTLISPDYLPDFKPATDAEAIAWCASKTNKTILIYGFDGEKVKYVQFKPASGYETRNEPSTLYDFYEQVMENNYIVCYTTFGVVLNDTKTEASFDMPTYDLTVDYELVRDMSVSVDAEILNRIRIQLVENKYVPVTPTEIIPAVTDNLDTKNPVTMTAATDYSLTLQKKGEGETPTWTDVNVEQDGLSVGIFRYQVTGTGLYDGIAYTNEFQLFEGYEVVIPAGEYATYYKDEALRVEDETIEIYTITAVEDSKAVLSEKLDASKANMPILVKNTSNEQKTVLLIPCNEPELAITVADEFVGTLENTTFSEDDMKAADYYVCNGKEFIKVRGAGTLAANMAYLKFVTVQQQLNAPQYINIVMGGDLGEGTTGIDASLVNSEEVNSVWYDLNGRRLQGKPSQKGIYIKNGRKVVIK